MANNVDPEEAVGSGFTLVCTDISVAHSLEDKNNSKLDNLFTLSVRRQQGKKWNKNKSKISNRTIQYRKISQSIKTGVPSEDSQQLVQVFGVIPVNSNDSSTSNTISRSQNLTSIMISIKCKKKKKNTYTNFCGSIFKKKSQRQKRFLCKHLPPIRNPVFSQSWVVSAFIIPLHYT